MRIAIEEARVGIARGDGGPFGAVIVQADRVIARAHNEVIQNSDPTAHAEMLAIRRAAQRLEHFNLSGCELYTTCEPCPMCLGAVYWSRISQITFGCSREDTRETGFDDLAIDAAICDPPGKLPLARQQLERESCVELFHLWLRKENRASY